MHVLGAGSLGGLFAARLGLAASSGGSQKSLPTLLLRSGSRKAALSAEGQGTARLTLRSAHLGGPDPAGEAHRVDVDVRSELVGAPGDRNIRTVLIATKAPATVAALEAIAPRLDPEAVLVLLSNGSLALSDHIKESTVLRDVQLVAASTTQGAWSKGDFDIVHAGNGRTWLGILPGHHVDSSRYAEILSELNGSGLGAEDEGLGIARRLWCKLAANAVINPLSALWECRNGGVLEQQEGTAVLEAVCQELAALAAAIDKQDAAAVPGDEARSNRRPPPPPSEEELADFVRSVVQETAANKSSMLQDMEAKRRTEIDYLNGWVATKGRSLGLPCPRNEDLAQRVKNKENDVCIQ